MGQVKCVDQGPRRHVGHAQVKEEWLEQFTWQNSARAVKPHKHSFLQRRRE